MIDTFEPAALTLPDGRVMDLYVGGPEDGTLLISHHGTPSAGLPLRSFVDAAAERGLRWASFSRPGYGGSTRSAGRDVAHCVRDVAAIADHLGAERFFTMGASGGGPHTLACAALLPARVRGCAAIAAPAPWGAVGLDWLAGQGPENIAEWEAAQAGSEALEAYLEKEAPSLREATEPQDLIDAIGGLLPEPDRAALTGEFAETLIASSHRAVEHGVWGGSTTTWPSSATGATGWMRSTSPSRCGRAGRTRWSRSRTASGSRRTSPAPDRTCTTSTATCPSPSARSLGSWTTSWSTRCHEHAR